MKVVQNVAYTLRRQNALLQSLLALFLFWLRETFTDIHRDLPKEKTLQVVRGSKRGQYCCFMVRQQTTTYLRHGKRQDRNK